MRLGAHVSVAGGLHNAIPAALEIGADTFQSYQPILIELCLLFELVSWKLGFGDY